MKKLNNVANFEGTISYPMVKQTIEFFACFEGTNQLYYINFSKITNFKRGFTA